jgi:D-beta-D-heptose 7-phosphate kinase/D-beta-D-heptose 1-phosphate adenosyltransferase
MPNATPTPDALIRTLEAWTPRRIVVAGDFMLDRHVMGNADRLSPDAPVPVLTVDSIENYPGGASNVCLDLRALRCEVACLGVVGREHPQSLFGRTDQEDSVGQLLRKALADAGCDVSGLVLSPDRVTTVKFNLVGLAQHRHPQKMFRVDAESKAPVPPEVGARLLQEARRLLRGADALCIEDYNKGVLTPSVCQGLIALARRAGVPVLVDPAAIGDYRRYRGATVITPNRTEAAVATGTPFGKTSEPRTLDEMARQLQRDLRLDAVVLTLDKQGILLMERRRRPRLLPTQAREVYDVTGAGDMVLAMLAAAVANGADWTTATQLANVAAGLEVEKFGVVPIPLDDVLVKLLHDQSQQLGKVRTLDTLLPELAALRKAGRRVAFTNGCFDILHAGHVHYLREARRTGDLLVVGLNSDASIRRIKGSDRPVNAQPDRVMVLSELQCVDYIVVFDEDTPIKLIRAVKPDVLVKGADYTREQVVGHDVVEKHGGRVELIPLVKGRSTTGIIRKAGLRRRA